MDALREIFDKREHTSLKGNGSAYQNDSLKTRRKQVRMETMSRHFMLHGQIEVVDRSRDSVDELQVGCLLQAVSNVHAIRQWTYKVAHRFKLHSTSHASGRLGFFYLSFIDF